MNPYFQDAVNNKSASLPVNLIDINDISLRHLCQEDIPELKRLCTEWFPVDYPDTWYQDIASNKKFYSIAAINNNAIIGIIVAEVKLKKTTDREDCNILSNKHDENTQITYILSLGVDKSFRRLGIASMLLDYLLSYLKAETDCKAIYLHVLCTNKTAISFYEKRKFQQRIFLPRYYTIQGKHHDGYCYVYYMNNGEPPWTMTYPFFNHFKNFFTCS
ncbi:unnamed protein product [Brachionus calyciflorus]|uniref:N-alpha-acetyltransferase 60 n=1 Tax=Brachionus calyciflorus TaxID=104777 RepID=A0A814HK73_9BILA|nr:unnamed protein product [Brachionus calyciflorus]